MPTKLLCYVYTLCAHIAPNIVTLFERLGPNFAVFYKKKGIYWKRLAARVLEIVGLPAWEYVDYIADNVPSF